MNNQCLIVYRLNPLYKVLKELEYQINFRVIETLDEKSLNSLIQNLKSYYILTKKEILRLNNQLVLRQFPIKITKIIEQLNIKFLKLQFAEQSKININNYILDINARKIISKSATLRLTEKEVNTIIYLSQANKPVTINELQSEVWGYHSGLETHTVETHIYRLRKKIFKNFSDDNFIISLKNGYQILQINFIIN